jgi:imidazolonepropionase-like amidohydrolase
MGALVAATKTSAELLGLDDRIGTLEEGKLADLVIFDGDPLTDIKFLQDTARVHVVMTGGTTVVDRTRA